MTRDRLLEEELDRHEEYARQIAERIATHGDDAGAHDTCSVGSDDVLAMVAEIRESRCATLALRDSLVAVTAERDALRDAVEAWWTADDDDNITGDEHWQAEKRLRALVRRSAALEGTDRRGGE